MARRGLVGGPEGRVPSVVDPSGLALYGMGDPVVPADPARGAFFAGDLHSGIGPKKLQFDT